MKLNYLFGKIALVILRLTWRPSRHAFWSRSACSFSVMRMYQDHHEEPLLIVRYSRCYSAWEHSTLTAQSPQLSKLSSSQFQSSPATTSLPHDISVEAIASVILICLGLVSGAEELKPISWRTWAGAVERESGGGGPYQGLEDRVGFVNIRAKRKEFADWVRSKDEEGQ